MSLSVIPKKSLGQNFLNSQRVISRIVESAELSQSDIVLEIGPGLGAITEKLLLSAGKVVAVEKDRELYAILEEKFKKNIQNKQFELIQGDIIELDPEIIKKNKGFTYKIAANIPYNITGLIIRKFLTAPYQPKVMVLLVQKEVADRIVAHDKKESLLSLSVKAYGSVKKITNVARGNFNPPPRVDSAVIKIDSISREHFPKPELEELFFKIIHAGFAHKRKVLLKNLVDAHIADRKLLTEIFNKRNLLATIRSEDLTLEDWLFITKLLYTNH